ncbi:MAG: hypothetical protein OXT65_11040 [Alphaproteobacteria bacterium]|nr:hypothetical protein [Alphaproteobacteria bacterium]
MKSPVVTSLSTEKLHGLFRFMDYMRQDNTIVAGLEAERLSPYLEVLSQQLRKDIAQAHRRKFKGKKFEREQELASPDSLKSMFRDVAQYTGNTILSELVMMPMGALNEPGLKQEEDTYFDSVIEYKDSKFALGFLQVFEKNEHGRKKSSTSVPVLAFDNKMMETLSQHKPEKLLEAMQLLASAGNHDMQHHYTNTILNPNIAQRFHNADEHTLGKAIDDSVFQWGRKNFSLVEDENPHSYESWLMLNHARIRDQIDEGPEGDKLREASDTFFEELERIGQEIASSKNAHTAHKVVDYFGTATIFMMGRFKPLNHPMVTDAIDRLQKADPQTDLSERIINAQPDSSSFSAKLDASFPGHVQAECERITDSLQPNADKNGYSYLKTLDIVSLSPWIAQIMAPQENNMYTASVRENIGSVHRDMLNAVSALTLSNFSDGKHTLKIADGLDVTIYTKNGQLHRDDGPAMIETDTRGGTPLEALIARIVSPPRTEYYFQNGKLHREDGPAVRKKKGKTVIQEEWHQKGAFFRADGGPTRVKTDYMGGRTEEWHKGLNLHRDGAPARIYKGWNRTEETWFQNGRKHRENGPAFIRVDQREGTKEERREEEWFLNDAPGRRGGGPTCVRTYLDGTKVFEWKNKSGILHNDHGPASVLFHPDGHTEIKWMKKGKEDREDDPAVIKTFPNGEKLEEWRIRGELHREDGPAQIITHEGGSQTKKWFKAGKSITPPKRQSTPAPAP